MDPDACHDAPTGGHQIAEAFVWETLPYLKRDGVAGLVLPAMTLFKKESTAFRQNFFASTRTWCVANFANLAEMLFAKGETPCHRSFFQQRNKSFDIDREESNSCMLRSLLIKRLIGLTSRVHKGSIRGISLSMLLRCRRYSPIRQRLARYFHGNLRCGDVSEMASCWRKLRGNSLYSVILPRLMV